MTLYDTFVIEARFGFNKTTLTTFLTDLLKSLSLAVVLGGPLLAGVMAFLAYGVLCLGVLLAGTDRLHSGAAMARPDLDHATV